MHLLRLVEADPGLVWLDCTPGDAAKVAVSFVLGAECLGAADAVNRDLVNSEDVLSYSHVSDGAGSTRGSCTSAGRSDPSCI